MWLKEFSRLFVNRPRTGRHARPQAQRRRGVRLALERLEDRTLPSNYAAAGVSDLMADINAANQAGGTNTITLAANTRFVLTTTDNTTNGANGLPVIAANDNLTIVGQGGDIISPEDANGVLYGYFRFFDTAVGATLTLSNLTLSNAEPIYEGFGGGAIYNEGSLVLNAVNVQNNYTFWSGGAIWSSGSLTLENGTLIQGNGINGQGSDVAGGGIWSSGTLMLQNATVRDNNVNAHGGDAAGGGIWSSGNLMLQDATVQSNVAAGGWGSDPIRTGGNAFGGGIWSSGNLTLGSGTLIQSNQAMGRIGAGNTSEPGGNAFGGGLYIAGGMAQLTGATVDGNLAEGEAGALGGSYHHPQYTGDGGNGYGGGLYAAAGATVTIRGDTVQSNTAAGGPGKQKGFGYGGGLFLATNAIVYLDAVTLTNTLNNTADRHPDIDGSYVLL
jgi:hypothetical protein